MLQFTGKTMVKTCHPRWGAQLTLVHLAVKKLEIAVWFDGSVHYGCVFTVVGGLIQWVVTIWLWSWQQTHLGAAVLLFLLMNQLVSGLHNTAAIFGQSGMGFSWWGSSLEKACYHSLADMVNLQMLLIWIQSYAKYTYHSVHPQQRVAPPISSRQVTV